MAARIDQLAQIQERTDRTSKPQHYLLAVVLCVAAWVGTLFIPDLANRSPFLLSLGATVIASWVGGWRVGLFTTALSLIGINYLFLTPVYTFSTSVTDLIHVVIFASVAMLISWLEASRRHSENEQRAARYQLEVILKNVADGITVQDKNGQPLFANDAAARLTGYPDARTMIETPITSARRRMESLTEEGKPISFDELPNRRAIREGISSEMAFQLKYLDTNEQRWIVLHSSPLLGSDGKPMMSVNIFRDVTASKNYERSLHQEREYLRNVLDNLPMAVGVTDLDGRFVTTNTVLRNLSRKEPESQAATDTAFAVDIVQLAQQVIADRDDVTRRLQRRTALMPRVMAGETVRYDEILDDVLRERHYLEVTMSPLYDADGKVIYIIHIVNDITAREEAESERRVLAARVQTEQQHLRAVLNNMPIGVGVLNPDGIIETANSAGLRYTGLTEETSIGQSLSEMSYIRDLPGAQERLRAVIERVRGGELVRYDAVAKDAQNAPMHLDFTLSPMKNAAGEVTHLIMTTIDISARKKVEAERAELAAQVQRERQHLLNVLDNMPVAVTVLDANGMVISTNRLSLEFSGTKLEDVVGYRLWDAPYVRKFPDAPEILQGVVKRVQDGEYIRYDAPGHNAEGEAFTFDFSLWPMYNADGVLINMIMTNVDITARKQAETQRAELTEALTRQGQRLSEIVANIPGMVWESSMNADGQEQAMFASDYVYNLTGYTPEEWCSQPNMYNNIVHPDDFEQAMRDAQVIMREGSGIIRSRWITKDGRIIFIEAHSSLITNAQGRITGARGVTMDITARRRTDDALARYALELRRSNEDLQQFAYVASHDLQEPLRMVTSYLQLLIKRYNNVLDDDAREFIGYAVDGSSRMKRLINDLLAYARVESRGERFKLFDSADALQRAADNLTLTIAENNVTLDIGMMPEITGDITQITQLFQNLIGNAIKFHGDAPPRIEIGAERQDGNWLFYVRDNGIGVEQQYLERIFVIFQRLHARDKYEGTGIGLAICKRVVERHGGTIRAESAPGEGTTVYFTIPVMAITPSSYTEVPILPSGSEFRSSKTRIPIVPRNDET